MSIEDRRQNILETAMQFNTLVELPQEYVERVAQGEGSPVGYSNHQIAAALEAARESKYEYQIILEWCAVERPPLFKSSCEPKNYPYEKWAVQHSLSPEKLAHQWAKECQECSGSINRVYEYVEFE